MAFSILSVGLAPNGIVLLMLLVCIGTQQFLLVSSKKEEFKVLPNEKERCLHRFKKNLIIRKALEVKEGKKEGTRNDESIGVFVYFSGTDEEKPVGINCGFKAEEPCFPHDEKEEELVEHILKHDFKLQVNETHIENTNRKEYEEGYLSHEFCGSGFCNFTETNGTKVGTCSSKCYKGIGCGSVSLHTSSLVFNNGDLPKDGGNQITSMGFGCVILSGMALAQNYLNV